STANPFATVKQYKMEFDTTELFNSPFKVTRTISSVGGLLDFDPGVTFSDNTVYYWRVGVVPDSGAPNWNNSSFIYLANSESGFNQSHYFQHDKYGKQRILFNPHKFSPNLKLTVQYGSALPCTPTRQWNYEYSYMTSASRKLAMDFMDSIPEGYIVVVRSISNYTQSSGFIDEWKADTTFYGQN